MSLTPTFHVVDFRVRLSTSERKVAFLFHEGFQWIPKHITTEPLGFPAFHLLSKKDFQTPKNPKPIFHKFINKSVANRLTGNLSPS